MIQFAYLKDVSNATFDGKLSPLHWDGAKAVDVTDQKLLDEFSSFITPLFYHLPLVYGCLDIARDANGALWLLEVNTAPSFSIFVRDNEKEKVVEMYKKMLEPQ